jgi:chemotaxis protein methyltransferase CheR
MSVTAAEIEVVAGLVFDLCGIVLDESKDYLIESRLASLVRKTGSGDYAELARKVRYGGDTALKTELIDSITTNETLFFRDGSPFEALKHKALPELFDAKARTAYPKRLRIWSAACSTGQEPYSIGMTLAELIPDIHSWDVSILATDISDAAIRQASAGRYSEMEMQRGLPPAALARYFTREATDWKVKDEIRSLVTFRLINLHESFQSLGPFDVIFCRNVAIYFSPAARAALFRGLAGILSPDGYMFVGSSESLADLGPEFMPQHHCRSVFYQPAKRRTASAASIGGVPRVPSLAAVPTLG